MFYRFDKKKHENNWFRKTAEEMDIELDEDNLYPFCLQLHHHDFLFIFVMFLKSCRKYLCSISLENTSYFMAA